MSRTHTHLGPATTSAARIRPMEKPPRMAVAPDFFQEGISKDLCFCSGPSHLVAFGKDVIEASPGPQGNSSRRGEGTKKSSLMGNWPCPRRASSSHALLPFKAESRNKRKGKGLSGCSVKVTESHHQLVALSRAGRYRRRHRYSIWQDHEAGAGPRSKVSSFRGPWSTGKWCAHTLPLDVGVHSPVCPCSQKVLFQVCWFPGSFEAE